MINPGQCTLCPAGSFADSVGVSHIIFILKYIFTYYNHYKSTTCKACPFGTYSHVGASQCELCTAS